MARRLAAIMFTDIAGYTSLAQSDEAGALALLKEQQKLLRPLLATHHGRKVKSIGDGLLLEFENALDAVECGANFQRQVHERNVGAGVRPLKIRVGIHLGDVQRQGTDILGDAVNIASRIEPLAEAGGVCLSDPVYVQVRNKVPYRIERLGPRTLKGVREPVDVYRLVLPWTREDAVAKEASLPRVAVLPFANISPDPKDEYFADGLTEELITVLSQVKGLRVISHTSVNQYKGTTKPVAQIGSELGVDTVLEGSVRKAGEQLRISVQLIDTGSDEHRWAQTYDRKLENVFAIQAEVAEQTAGALKVELLKSEREALLEKPTSNLAAYESYLRGIQAFRNYTGWGDEKHDREAERCFEEAIREDPDFSAAYSYLANHLLAVMGVSRSAKDTVPRARELAAKALELNPNSSDAHVAAGNVVFQGDLNWARAEAEFQQAIALNPSSSAAREWYGYLLWVLGRFEEAKKQDGLAIELDPLWILARHQLVLAHENSDLGEIISMLEKLVESFPDSVGTRRWLTWYYAVAGRTEEALRSVEPLAGTTDPAARYHRSIVLALLGRPEEAEARIAEWEAGRISQYISPVDVAVWYAFRGETEKALDLLERDFREGDRTLWNEYRTPAFDSIREEPRFIALLRAMNLPTTPPHRRWKFNVQLPPKSR
ncbi:MAG TPA: adenylate/guanylate cyclase domain-containing protein [Thermoplasmata archaeon]|nr:adenylate/guanylate cyclase domain-containing protein [Thermoplasmata archaeon]